MAQRKKGGKAVKKGGAKSAARYAALKRIGMLTGGGDCPGLNGVIRAVTRTAINIYGWEVIGFEDGFEGMIYPGKSRVLDHESTRGILHRGGTILGSTNRGNPFSFPVQKRGKTVSVDCSDMVADTYRRQELDALVVIGGDGTLKIAERLAKEKGIRVMGVPKTIDNDLSATEVTFGFDTAVATATEAIDKLHTTAESHHRIMLVEVMGRDAGWIALHAGLAGGADAILVPEIEYDMKKMIEVIRAREEKGRKSSIVVVAEGARPVGGAVSTIRSARPPFDLVRLGGAAQRVADELEALTGRETRVTVLGHVQRGGSPVPYDRNLASRFGVAAVQALARGEYSHMVALHADRIISVPLKEAINKQKFVDPKGEMVITAEAVGISFCGPDRNECK
ncbi:MAG TPA: ATP-dependent 6-phosphofructokinase [bacterium]|nr:ATP-dependent 6-phosphofructokinase [bacterium]